MQEAEYNTQRAIRMCVQKSPSEHHQVEVEVASPGSGRALCQQRLQDKRRGSLKLVCVRADARGGDVLWCGPTLV